MIQRLRRTHLVAIDKNVRFAQGSKGYVEAISNKKEIDGVLITNKAHGNYKVDKTVFRKTKDEKNKLKTLRAEYKNRILTKSEKL